jgi:hypothetical protein
MLTPADHELYKIYKKLDNPEYFQRYFIAWYENGGIIYDDDVGKLRNKLAVYDALGLDRKVMCECQDVVPASVLLAFWSGAELSQSKCRKIKNELPYMSEKKTPRKSIRMN